MSNSNMFIFFFFFFISFASSSSFNATHKCSPHQSLDLLLFKENMTSIDQSYDKYDYDYFDSTSSCEVWLGSGYHPITMNWNKNTDCCKWDGITCNHLTGDVIGIDLSCGMLQGTIHPNTTLFHLPHLQTLNLAFNNFSCSQLPRNIGGLSNSLTLLNLSFCGFSGDIPGEILYLPKLVTLDLSRNDGLQLQPSILKNLLLNSTHLRELLLKDVDISWVLPRYLNISTSLKSLDLSNTSLQGKLPDNIFGLHYLEKLDMSNNIDITGQWPNVNKSNNIPLKWLDLSHANLSGEIPESIGHLKFLNNLRLYSCGLVGSIPKFLVNLRHLTTLDLSSNKLNGTLPSLLFTLPFLENIDLYGNMLSGGLPSEFFNCRSLKMLSLSKNNFDGKINGGSTPTSFTQLAKLTSLELARNNFIGSWDLSVLLLSLPNLEVLSLSYSGLIVVSNNNTRYVNHKLRDLGLASCNLHVFPESLRALKNLTILDLSSNKIHGRIPDWAQEIGGNGLRHLDLSNNFITSLHARFQWGGLQSVNLEYNQIKGPFPPSICGMTGLQDLDISNNNFDGVLPQCLGNITSSLKFFNVESNKLQGSFPSSICDMTGLQDLDISNNSFDGVLPQCLGNITYFNVKSNKLQGSFPSSICGMTGLYYLDISNNSFDGVLPQCLGNITSSLWFLDVNSNKLQGSFPSSICGMTGLRYLDISNNSFDGVLPQCLGNITSSLEFFNVKSNKLHGSFPPSICGMTGLHYLDISNNSFDGVLPQCLGNISSYLKMVDMGNNDFHGIIPNVYECGRLQGLILNGNRLQGEVPRSLSKCQYLKVLDLGNNQLNGTFPGWLGDLPELQVLVLKSNKFHGRIETPSTTKNAFPSIRVLILSHNEFVGLLPQTYLQNFSAMKNTIRSNTTPSYLDMGGKYYSVTIAVKGVVLEFPKISVDYIILDLSNNRFEGEIPSVIGCLTSLIVLDLSHNNLTGQIPSVLGNLSEIESLDLSWNQLTGEIPQSLAGLKFLEFLNLSQNHLKGRIPSGGQFNTFGTSFEGNPKLCGFPLQKTCELPHEPQFEANGDGDGDGERGFTWRVVMLGFGCGTLIGLVMGYVMLSTGTPKWFNAIADAGEHMIQTKGNKRRYVYIGR